jgi:5-methylcytosine-specific restriction endonuclease McrA
VSGAPDPKSRTLARGERRYRRKVASPKQWQAIIEAKRGPCRVCGEPSRSAIFGTYHLEYHHLIGRSQGGDDVADNIAPLCGACHYSVTMRRRIWLRKLAASLTDAEYAYVVGKLGEGRMARLFGTDAA